MIIIPFLFIGFAKDYARKQSTFAIPIGWPDLSMIDGYKEMFAAYRNHFPPLRNYTKIRLDANQRTNQTKFDFAAIQAMELVESNDTLSGLHFVFNKESSYGNFVKAVDICRMVGAKTYMPYENNLWVYNLPTIQESMTAGSQELYWVCASIVPKYEKDNLISTNIKVKLVWNSSWQIIIGFLLLVIISIRSVILRNKRGLNKYR